jgi:hypothetical protein
MLRYFFRYFGIFHPKLGFFEILGLKYLKISWQISQLGGFYFGDLEYNEIFQFRIFYPNIFSWEDGARKYNYSFIINNIILSLFCRCCLSVSLNFWSDSNVRRYFLSLVVLDKFDNNGGAMINFKLLKTIETLTLNKARESIKSWNSWKTLTILLPWNM